MPLLLNLLPARFLLTLREWFDYKISHCVLTTSKDNTLHFLLEGEADQRCTRGGEEAQTGGAQAARELMFAIEFLIFFLQY